jgi:hypothetical protein
MEWFLLIAALVGLFWVFKPWQMFAGDAGILDAPFPHDKRIWLPLSISVLASKSADYVTTQFKLPWAVRVKRAFLTAEDISITNAITINLEDDESTPNVVISDEAPTAITAGAGNWEELTVDIPNTTILAGAILVLSYGSGASDTITNGTLWLELEPLYR